MDWSEAMELWRASNKSAESQRAYKRAWASLRTFAGKEDPGEISRLDVNRWTGELKRRGLRPATIAQMVSAIRGFYGYARRELEMDAHNPASSSSLRPKVEMFGKSRALTVDEARALLGAINRDTWRGMRDYALILGYLVMGRRNSEWRCARVGDFSQTAQGVELRWSNKGKEDQMTPVPVVIWQAVKEWTALGNKGPDDYIFTGAWQNRPLISSQVNNLLRKYARLAGIGGRVHVHMLRHTAASLRRQVGDSPEDIQRMLGHANLAVTQIYLHGLEGRKDVSWEKVGSLLGLAKTNVNKPVKRRLLVT